MRTIHNFPQGSDAWLQHRAHALNASEAPMLMNASKYGTRADLLRQKATGIAPEVSAAKQALFDRGHAVEIPTIAMIEDDIGEALAPVVASMEIDGLLLGASYDGLSMFEDVGAEIKLWNEDLAAQVRAGVLDMHYVWQLEHQLAVTPTLERIIFATSDGTREKFASMEYRRVPGRAEQLISAWRQFGEDLATYVPTEAAPVVTAQPTASLPAVSVRVDGALAVISNLPAWGVALREFIGRIPAKPASDQEFADCDSACKKLKEAEQALDAAEANALGQITSVEEMTRMVADLRTLARTTRLASEKMVTARKLQIRTEEVQRGKDAFAAHIAGLNARLGRDYMPAIAINFAAAISGKKNIDSLRNAIDSELARGKIAANEVADRLDLNLRYLREHAKDFGFLFADTATIIQKAPDDLQVLVKSRIADHEAAEQQKADDLREKIRAEEQAKAEKDAREKLEREQQDAQAQRQREAQAAPAEQQRQQTQAPAGPSNTAAPAPAPNVRPLRQAADSSLTIRLGVINERLAPIALTAEGLASLGFQPVATEKAAKLYRQSDFPRIAAALISHIEAVCQPMAA